ncbi:MAG: hypothetical protein VST68_01650 [Nitrospirota bacterium]|nr:hypothetical protein [Nitrospirota bacterium]
MMQTNQPNQLWYLTIGPKSPESFLQTCIRLVQSVWQTCIGSHQAAKFMTQPQEEAMAKDTLGRMISIGDTVAYAVRDGNSADLKIGDVIRVKEGRICIEAENSEGRLTKRTLSHLDRIAVLQSPTA